MVDIHFDGISQEGQCGRSWNLFDVFHHTRTSFIVDHNEYADRGEEEDGYRRVSRYDLSGFREQDALGHQGTKYFGGHVQNCFLH